MRPSKDERGAYNPLHTATRTAYKASMAETPISKLTKSAAEAELKSLAEAIRAADAAYYQDDAPELTDADYDALRNRLNAIEAKFPDLKGAESPSQKVGAAPTGDRTGTPASQRGLGGCWEHPHEQRYRC